MSGSGIKKSVHGKRREEDGVKEAYSLHDT
jgi:hypothetical protein